MKFIRCSIVAILFGIELAQAVPPADDEIRMVQFADSLMLQQRFRESELEYERLAATHPEAPDRITIIQKMFDASMAAQDYTFTLKLARAWREKTEGPASCLSSLYEGHALYQLGNYPAVLKLQLLSTCDRDPAHRITYLHGLSRMRLWQWPEARNQFDQIPANSELNPQARRASERTLLGPRISKKSPALAAGLNAILPGAGYAYANRPQTAAACFAVNGLFIWGTVASIHAKEPGLAALLSLFSFGWYSGGVYGGAQAAEKETQHRLTAVIEPVELIH